jgi:coenzyme F420 hydrogenase subunit beta
MKLNDATKLPDKREDADEDAKSFKDLIKEVYDKGLCGSCAGCVSFCSSHELGAIGMNEEGRPVFVDEDNCLKCGICYFICPQIKVFDEELKDKYTWKPPVGRFRKILTAQAVDDQIKKKATDGGVVTGLLDFMLTTNLIDGAIVSKKTGNPFERTPILATNREDLIAAAGSEFSNLTQVEELGNYNSYSPTMAALKDMRNIDMARIAVVGTPCQIHTIRKMQVLGVLPSHVVKFTIGLFCMENFSFDQKAREDFEKKAGIKLKDVSKMNIKDGIIFDMNDGKRVDLSFEKIEPLVRSACLSCLDFSNDFADISVGGLGSPDGYTTTMLRTEIGLQRFEEAVEAGYISVYMPKTRKNWSKERTKILAKIINFAQRKRERGLKQLKESPMHAGGN